MKSELLRETSSFAETPVDKSEHEGHDGRRRSHLVLEASEPQGSLSKSSACPAQSVEGFFLSPATNELVRAVRTHDGSTVESALDAPSAFEVSSPTDAFDWAWLRQESRPSPLVTNGSVRLVDLFSGCGGMSVGVDEATRALNMRFEPVMAVDIDAVALGVYGRNFPGAELKSKPVETLVDSDLGERLSGAEAELKEALGSVDLLVGGPPCQGNSDLNNRTRRNDVRNALFAKMARFAEVCEPQHIIVENVMGVRHDREAVFHKTWRHLEQLGYHVDGGIVRCEFIGVPQTRPRVILIASQTVPAGIHDLIERYRTAPRTFDWACRDLDDYAAGRGSRIDESASTTDVTRSRIDHLFEHGLFELPDHLRPGCHRPGHTYGSVYGRIHGDRPAPTMTTGFMTMGQGRFVHPRRRRTLTPHEAARIQFFPDWFDFGEQSRASYTRLIGNAVPPRLAYVAALELLR